MVPPITPSVTNVVHFDTAAPEDGKILISKAVWDVGYPSALQLASSAAGLAEIRIAGTRRDAVTLQPRPGIVYLRVTDPPDTAPYRGSDAHDGDNDGAIATINGTTSTSVQTDAQGKFGVTLVATSGGGWQLSVRLGRPGFNAETSVDKCQLTDGKGLCREQRMFRRDRPERPGPAATNEIPSRPGSFPGTGAGESFNLSTRIWS